MARHHAVPAGDAYPHHLTAVDSANPCLSAVDEFAFDVCGFLVLRAVALGVGGGDDELDSLHAHPAVAAHVGELSGANQYYKLIPGPVERIEPRRRLRGTAAVGGDGRARGYRHHQGKRVLGGVRALWAHGASGVEAAVVPGSHRCNYPAPEALLAGEDDLGRLGHPVLLPLQLAPGDVLLLAATTLYTVRKGEALACEFTRTFIAGEHIPTEWEEPLSPELQALLRLGDDAAGVGEYERQGGHDGLDATPALLLDPDGQTTLGALEPRDPPPVDDEQFYWDLTGMLILRNVLPPELLAAANAAVDAQSAQIDATRERVMAAEPGAPGSIGGTEWPDGTAYSDKMLGAPRMDLGALLALPTPWCIPFRQMATHLAILERLLWIQGPGSKLNGIGTCIVSEPGCGGQALHACGSPLEAPPPSPRTSF